MKNYVGIDLHGTNSYIGIIDQDGKRIFNKRTLNELNTIIMTLKPFQNTIKTIAIESTFNWYWLVDGLMDEGYNVSLANVPAMKQYEGIKYTDDKSDAFWLAEMLRLNILPTGYIYPKNERPIRDLLRRRMQLVQHRTSLYLSMASMIQNCTSIRLTRSEKKDLSNGEIERLLSDPHQIMSAQAVNDIIAQLNQHINCIEKEVIKKLRLRKAYKKLLTVWGIGEILGITIMLETGDIRRFQSISDYSSYSRCVPTRKTSNGKIKGKGNKKNGNKYLAWTYLEAAHYMQRAYPKARAWVQRKTAKKGRIIAYKALSNKIARACYYVIRDQVDFNPTKLFA